MNLVQIQKAQQASEPAPENPKVRRAVQGESPTVFTDIYQDDVNIAVWQREFSASLRASVDAFLAKNPLFQSSMTATPDNAQEGVMEMLKLSSPSELSEDIAQLVDMFCYLFDVQCVGLRLTVLDRAMCPKFHVDRVPGRLVTTYQGIATEWLSHEKVDRSKLGTGSQGKPDHESGIYQSEQDIQILGCGDVALLKGEMWEGNEGAGLVHRSPKLEPGDKRLLMTLDFID